MSRDFPPLPKLDPFPPFPMPEAHQLDVYLEDGRAVDVQIDGESVFPTWFKLEFKESGDVSAKVKGIRLSSRGGDVINIHRGRPGVSETPTASEVTATPG